MPGITLPAISNGDPLYNTLDANFATVRTYLKGNVPVGDLATSAVHAQALPRPAIYGSPIHAAYGETQDVFGVDQAKRDIGPWQDRAQGRQDIYGSTLDPQGRARLHMLCWRGRVPRYSRLTIHAQWSALVVRGAGAAALAHDYGGCFNLRLQEPGQDSALMAGARRDAPQLGKRVEYSTMYHTMGWVSPSAANLTGQFQVWVEYDKDASEFFTAADPNAVHMMIGNANMVIRCFKDYT